MRPLILSIFALFLAGCTHSQQSMVDTFRASLFDNQDITVADQQIRRCLIPRCIYALMKGNESLWYWDI